MIIIVVVIAIIVAKSGATVSDLAPETFANDKYSGSQDSSKDSTRL